jgi:hypothetical protein
MDRDWDHASESWTGGSGAGGWSGDDASADWGGGGRALRMPAMSPAWAAPPPIAGIERRLAALATEAWAVSGGGYVGGFDVNTVLIADPAGRAIVEEVGDTIATCFGIVPGMALARRPGLAGELAAACDLIALSPRPLPFEASAAAAGGALLLVRGIALPIAVGADSGRVQAILSWREVLNRAATRQLRLELGAALMMARRGTGRAAARDPFADPRPFATAPPSAAAAG